MHTLRDLGTLKFAMPSTLRLPDSPAGTRVIVEFDNAVFDGPKLRAKQKGVAADWLSIGPHGVASLDIRLTLETDDGALIYMEGHGRTDAAQFATKGGPMVWAPRFETGDERYRWLNLVQAVSSGWSRDGGAEFVVSELVVAP